MTQTEDISQLIAAICAVMLDVPAVGASSTNTHQRYKYTSDAELLCALQPSMARHGLAIVPMQSAPTVVERSTSSGKGGVRIDLVQTYRICHSSGQWMTAEVMGCGTDTQDKAPYKAMTGAFKYILRQTFAVPTGDDAERTVARREREQAQAQTPRVSATEELGALFRQQVEAALASSTVQAGKGASATVRSALEADRAGTERRVASIAWGLIMPGDMSEEQARKTVQRLRTEDGQKGLRRQFYTRLPVIAQRLEEPQA